MTDPKEIAAQAVASAQDPAARRRARLFAILAAVFALTTVAVGGYALHDAIEGEDRAALTAEQAAADRRALLSAVGQECAAGTIDTDLRYLCDQAKQLRQSDTSEVQERELQNPEIQEREEQESEEHERERQQIERQDREFQNPEINQLERQEGEVDNPDPDDPEQQDAEVDQPEPDDPEPDDPEPDDPEPDDPEVDDPDPNSALTFQVEDNCSPAEGQFVTDVGASWRRSPGVITLVLTCTTAPVPPPGVQP